MKVLLTGASGFVGSHILDALVERAIPVVLLLRKTASVRFIQQHLPNVTVHHGSVTDASTLLPALQEVTHVIHCAGRTKALRPAELHEANQQGTRNVVDAINTCGHIQRFVHISSLAVSGPGDVATPVREDDPLRPVTEYGRSKLAGEREIRERCTSEFVIVRPPAVYGPRDADFLILFQMIRKRFVPMLGGGRQALSLVFARDLARGVIECLNHPAAAGRTYSIASNEVVTSRELINEVARQMNIRPIALPVPSAVMWPICALQEFKSRVTGKPNILSRDKLPELTACGWVCDSSRIRSELGFAAATKLQDGIATTLDWYRTEKWL